MTEVEKIVDEWLESIAQRWDDVCDNKIPAHNMHDIPSAPGDITFQELIDEVRSRKVN